MVVNAAQVAKRAFVKVLLRLATAYRLFLGINRDSNDQALTSAYRKLARKVHPDKGGSETDQKTLNSARDAWEAAFKAKRASGRPKASPSPEGAAEMMDPEQLRRKTRAEYRIQSEGVMLTYNGIEDVAQWLRFCKNVENNLKQWDIKYWCATLEKGERADNFHVHLYLQFRSVRERSVRTFTFEAIS